MTAVVRVAAALAGLALAWTLLPHAVRLDQEVAPRLPVEAGLLVPEYGDEGTYGLDYRHHDEVTITVPVGNDGPLPVRVTEASIDQGSRPLLVAVDDNLPVTLGPWGDGEVELTYRFDNCRYYHERSADSWDHVALDGSVLGRGFEEDVALAFPLALHGQVIGDCPDRTLVRGDDVRPR